MRFYLDIIKFNFLEELAYPIEIFAYVIRRILNLGFLVLFWFVISDTNPDLFDFRKIISYFLIAGAVEDLSFTSHGGWDRDVRKMIKKGLLTNYLIKPINILRFWFMSYVGRRTTVNLFGIISLAAGIYIYPPRELEAVFLFILSLFLAMIAGTGLNLIVGSIAFYSPEAGNISNVIDHITNVLSGHLIPLSYFPLLLRKFAYILPFPVLTYFPVTILQEGSFDKNTFLMLGLSFIWAVILLVTSNFVWKKSLKNYDGIGI